MNCKNERCYNHGKQFLCCCSLVDETQYDINGWKKLTFDPSKITMCRMRQEAEKKLEQEQSLKYINDTMCL